MTLKEIRANWESTGSIKVVLVTPTNEVIVLLSFSNDSYYYIHRYFQVGELWNVSVDHKNIDFNDIFEKLSSYFEEFIPK